ncbi:MAG: DapH/DapD/GlmU-related protein [Alphaproteobacteria bacterium]
MTAKTLVHPSAEIAEGARIGEGCRIWQACVVLAGAELGDNVKLAHNVFVEGGVRIGAGTTVKDNVALYDGVVLEKEVFVGPGAVFTNVRTPRAFIDAKDNFEPTIVRRGASIGAGAILVCGVTIGRYAMIGSGSVVTANVPDHALVLGNPARAIGWVGRLGTRLDGKLTCPNSGERYRRDGEGLILIDKPNAVEK